MFRTNDFLKGGKVVLKAIIVRLVFILHAILVVYRAVVAWQNPWLWFLLTTLILLVVEAFITFKKRKGKEWVRFSPAILLYLLAAIPPIWLLEIRRLQSRTVRESNATSCFTNSSSTDKLSDKLNVKFGLCIDLGQWAMAMEQALLFIVIFGKWLMPKGNITKNQLSQILLVYVGTGADIMELFDGLDDREKVTSSILLTTLALWSWALLQFCFTLTTRSNSIKEKESNEEECNNNPTFILENGWKLWFHVTSYNLEILGILSTIVMQDGPFLIYRIYLLSGKKAISQTMVFFTCKNLLVISLQIYRLIVIFSEEKHKLRSRQNTQLEVLDKNEEFAEDDESKQDENDSQI